MAKAKFERTKPHVNVGTIGHVDHGKTTLTAALTKVSADKGLGTYVSYDQVAKASESQGRRDATKILTIATSHVEYSTPARPQVQASSAHGPQQAEAVSSRSPSVPRTQARRLATSVSARSPSSSITTRAGS